MISPILLLDLILGFTTQFEPWHEISNNVACATSKGSDQPAHMRRLIRDFASCLNILWVLSYSLNMIWSFLAWNEAAQARLSLRLSKCHIVGNHMSRLKCNCATVGTPAFSDTYKTSVFIFIFSGHPGFWETTIEVLVTIIPGCKATEI